MTGSDDNKYNRFYVDSKTGKMYRPPNSSGTIAGKDCEVAMVRRNAQRMLAATDTIRLPDFFDIGVFPALLPGYRADLLRLGFTPAELSILLYCAGFQR
ncbi:MAG: hypothetical protein AB2L14_37085 [Candidatus Xenobiia bacterium LiM19]